jgi:hypothetical protein
MPRSLSADDLVQPMFPDVLRGIILCEFSLDTLGMSSDGGFALRLGMMVALLSGYVPCLVLNGVQTA